MTYQQSLFLIFITLLSFFPVLSISANTLVPKQSLTGNQTLVSEGQRFELGFFSPGNSINRYYLGIWYKDISPQTIVWVANRNTPFTDSSGGRLMMDENGHLLLLNQSSTSLIWSSNQSTVLENPVAKNTIAKLLDSGNLVVTVESSDGKDQGSYRWQSFNHATDTILPGMKLGWDPETGVNNSLVSWSSAEDPSPGDFTYAMKPGPAPEVYVLKKQTPIYRTGPWNGREVSGIPEMASWVGFSFTFIHNEHQKYYSSATLNESILARVVLGTTGRLQRLVSLGGGNGWTPYWEASKDQCDVYNQCGAYGICDTSGSWICRCVKGFVPKNQREWNFRDGSEGCVLSSTYECGKDDGFLKLKRTKLPDCSKTYYNQSMDLKECREMCKRNCSCSAYANSDVTNGGTGCIIWIDELVDLRLFAEGGQDLYVRVAASELDNGHKSIVIIVVVTVISLALLFGSIICFIWMRKKRTQKRNAEEKGRNMQMQELPLFNMFLPSATDTRDDHKSGHTELPLIDFDIIVAVTDNFSNVNKLGEGGFGSVYKGTLMDGQQIAVKRLSQSSGQGIEEFKNEVMLIAKLQHRNLVRLLGCCLGNQEKMLIYEYMPNKSLDSFLFDKVKGQALDWGKRFSIIFGIARGLLYLHQDSRLRIIHRDLKASNILLDDEMNPKISDFGMARIFGNDQTEANTRRVVGTYGYMAPEYAMDGLFSVKSDVFSYGVLVLEIISGKKNKAFYSSSHQVNLLGYAWRLWEEGKILELTDTSISDSCSMDEVLKCIHVGLLCVQEHAEDRPTISSVISMLGSESTTLAKPKKPGFSLINMHNGQYLSSNDRESCSVNDVTVTLLEAR